MVRHFVPAQHGLGPVLEAWLEDFESFFRVGDVVVVAETVAGEMVLVGAVAAELEDRGESQVISESASKGTRLTLKLGSVSQEMRLAPQRHLASVYTIFEVVGGSSRVGERYRGEQGRAVGLARFDVTREECSVAGTVSNGTQVRFQRPWKAVSLFVARRSFIDRWMTQRATKLHVIVQAHLVSHQRIGA